MLSCIIFIFSLAYADTDCDKSKTLESFKSSKQIILNQVKQLSLVSSGVVNRGVSLNNIFGHNFKLEESDSYIQKLQKLNEREDGIAPENRTLSYCLKKLKLKSYQNELIKISKEFNNLKIQLFNKNKNLNDLFKKSLEVQADLPEFQKELQKESIESQKIKKELEQDLLKSEGQSLKEKDFVKKEIIAYKNALIRYNIELIEKKLDNIKALEEKINYLSLKSQNLSLLSKEPSEQKQLEESFRKIDNIWLEVTQEDLYKIFNKKFSFSLPVVPELPRLKESSRELESELLELAKKREEAIFQRQQALKELTNKEKQELKFLNELILNINSLRSEYFSKLETHYIIRKILASEYLKLLKNEIVSSPYRVISFFYSKFLYVNEKISRGREGISELVFDFFKLLFIIFLFFSLKLSLDKIYTYLDDKQNKAINYYRNVKSLKVFSSFWVRIKPNFTDIIWILLIQFLISNSYFRDITILLKVANVIFISRVIKHLVILFLGSVSKIDIKSFASFKKKAKLTSEHFSNIYLAYFLTMIFIEATVGKVYIYSIFNIIVVLFSIYRLMNAASEWEDEFKTYLERKFSGVITEKIDFLLKYMPVKVRAILIFVSIVLLSALDIFIKATENFEISKKISANLFKKQIENIEAEDGADKKIPQEYKNEFKYNSITNFNEYVVSDKKLEASILLEIHEWFEEKSDEHSVVIYGDKGIGKTTLLKHIISNLEIEETSKVQCIYSKMPSKTTNKESLEAYLLSLFGQVCQRDKFDIYEIDSKLDKKTVVVIDEAQNMFLSQTGGFEAYYSLINLINLNTEKIFWAMSFNKYSWLYLDRAFGRNQFFRNVYELSGWSDTKIKELILKRHQKSPYKLSYDLLINATRSQDEMDRYASIESKFFKLLWELSRGNPRAALSLWVSALSRKNRGSFNVNIPKELELSGIEKLPDDLMFVIAHVLKHENLLSVEIESTTNLPKGIVRNAIKVCLERKFLYRDERGRYMIDISSQYGLIRYLRLKNFIYGS